MMLFSLPVPCSLHLIIHVCMHVGILLMYARARLHFLYIILSSQRIHHHQQQQIESAEKEEEQEEDHHHIVEMRTDEEEEEEEEKEDLLKKCRSRMMEDVDSSLLGR